MKTLKLSIVAGALALAACAHIPGEPGGAPKLTDAATAALAPDIHLAREGWPAAQWWKAYGDAQLDALVARSIASAPGLDVAKARIGQAGASLDLARDQQGFGMDLEVGANRQRYSANGLFPEPIGGNYFSDYSVQVRAGYDFDWWGKHRAQIAATLGEVYARKADLAQAEQVLAANVAQSYYRLQGGRARAANLNQLVAAQQSLIAEKAKRIARGLAVNDEQRVAEGELAALKRQLAQLDAQVRGEREALRALVGAGPDALADLRDRPLPSAPHALPAKLGVDLLAHRADLQAARWRVTAALSSVQANEAAFYPDLNLRGAIGLDALSLDKLFQFGSRTMLISPVLSLPVFHTNALNAQLGSARAQRDAVVADYNQAVLNAVRDVAQRAVAVQGIDNETLAQRQAQDAARAVLRNTEARYQRGLQDNAALLNARVAVLKQQDNALQLDSTRLQAELALAGALGGGYWNQDTATPALSSLK
jgi:multidrug efflux system outer membrane protein